MSINEEKPKFRIYDLFPFVWYWKDVARSKYKRMIEIEEEYGPRFNTVLRTMGISEYTRLESEVDDIIAWCKKKEELR